MSNKLVVRVLSHIKHSATRRVLYCDKTLLLVYYTLHNVFYIKQICSFETSFVVGIHRCESSSHQFFILLKYFTSQKFHNGWIFGARFENLFLNTFSLQQKFQFNCIQLKLFQKDSTSDGSHRWFPEPVPFSTYCI